MRKGTVFETFSPQETYDLGRKLGREAYPGQVICLDGDLGVGKTVFTQGFAQGLGVEGPVNSPTFTILQTYEDGRLPLYHFDVYRIGDAEEMDEIGYEEYFYGEGVCLIEWPSRIEEIVPPEAARITIEKALEKGFDYRRITVQSKGEKDYEIIGDRKLVADRLGGRLGRRDPDGGIHGEFQKDALADPAADDRRDLPADGAGA